jgi:GxxExxY protein
MLIENEIAKQVVDAAFQVHTRLGPGLFESVYQAVLVYELKKRGLCVETEVPIPVHYDGLVIEIGFRADIIVNDSVIIELKSVEQIAPVHQNQLLTYLRLADKRLGLLINFGTVLIKKGIYRVVNGLPEENTLRP